MREDALRTSLNEHDDEAQDEDLSQHGASHGLEVLVYKAETEAACDRACELADAAQDYDHERVDDVLLTELRADITELR